MGKRMYRNPKANYERPATAFEEFDFPYALQVLASRDAIGTHELPKIAAQRMLGAALQIAGRSRRWRQASLILLAW